ncbi:hypothetical protein [Actinospongicola halichondriae]|uniref:hypothetical protein n=1 Tax=Actinospongicola halichondriae TaxID=3236844 RepID=UPI003D4430BC
MHPIERLRYVARSGGADHSALAEEAARALAGFSDDPSGLVTACRRIVDRHPTSGPMWWLASKVLASNDPRAESVRCVTTLQGDPTAAAFAYELPDDVTVTAIGWPEQIGEALVRRGDIRSLVVDSLGEGAGLVRRLEHADSPSDEVPPANIGGAVRWSNVVALEASAVGPDGFVAVAGSLAAASVAATTDAEVWLVAGEGRLLPERLWQALTDRLDQAGEPWELDEEIVPLSLVDHVVGPKGKESVEAMLRRTDTPIVPELLKQTL